MKENRFAISGSHGHIGGELAARVDDPIRVGRYARKVPNFDVFVDCATYGNMYNHTEVSQIYQANVDRFINLLLKNHDQPYSAFIAVSSLAVNLPHTTFYSASKKAMEEFVQVYVRETNKPVVIVRPATVYGPNEQNQHLVPKLIDSCLNGTKIPFVGDPVHDFVYVDDVVDAILLLSENARDHSGEIFEIGTGIQTTNREVKEIIEKITNRKANIEEKEQLRAFDTKEWKANIEPLQKLGWQPKHTLEHGLAKMIYESKRKNIANK